MWCNLGRVVKLQSYDPARGKRAAPEHGRVEGSDDAGRVRREYH